MPTRYKYKAVSETGQRQQGIISALGPQQVEEYLDEQGLLPVRITELKDRKPLSFAGFQAGADYEKLIMFTNSLSTMYRAGIPLLRALSIIKVGRPGGRFNHVIDRIRMRFQSGVALSEAMREFDDVFSRVHTASVAAGEESGKLDQTLDELSDMLEGEMELNRQIKSALRYPLTVILVIIAAAFVLMTFVVPRFVGFYSSFGTQLPLPTRIFIGVSDLVASYWPLMLTAAIALLFGFRQLVSNPRGRLWFDRRLLRLPVIGNLIVKGNVARFCLMFRILFNSGLPIVRSLSILVQAVKNTVIAEEIAHMEELFRRGRDVSMVSPDFEFLPEQAQHMIAIGLESGSLERMLKEIGDHYSKEVLYTSRQLTSIIEPILTLVLGAFVLILALAIFLPMWSLIKVFSG